MKRAVIYARFSTDHQDERSIEDQVALCRDYARREQLDVIEVFEDRARSGASILNRDGLLALMAGAQSNAFDAVVVEALDRLSRDMEDLAGIHKRLTYRGIEIRAVHEGIVNTVLVGLRGLVGQLYREDGAAKVRRGMLGRVKEGSSGGGIQYGYAQVPGQPGKRVIVDAEAEVIRRIFAEYVAGRTPRAIAHDLNREKITPPRGRQWNASTINGEASRGTGIIRCELYVGRLVWNKVRMIKDPDTGKRVSRPNPPNEWQVVEVPDLAIVSREQFDAAQGIKRKNKGVHFSKQRAPKRLLSGLLRCAACGGGMSSKAADKTGRVRIRCTTAHESGTCPDPHTFYLDDIENRVLAALRAEMQSPAAVAEFVKAYSEERVKLAAKRDRERATIERRLGEVRRALDRMVDDVTWGRLDATIYGPKTVELDQERKLLEAELKAAPPQPIALHPGILADYERKLERLQAAIEQGTSEGNTEYGQAIRDLVESVTVQHDVTAPDNLHIDITGRLNNLLGDNAFPNRVGGKRSSGGGI
jgi:DNA invertase Pin-like site-specific DNA recombinase